MLLQIAINNSSINLNSLLIGNMEAVKNIILFLNKFGNNNDLTKMNTFFSIILI